MPPEWTQPGIVTLWAHGRAHVRLDDGRELVCVPGSKVRGQVVPGTRVLVFPSGDVGRIVARVDEEGPPTRARASERRRLAAAERESRD